MMAKGKIEPSLQKKMFLLITSAELNAFMQINHFSDEDQDRVKKSKQEFSEACIIFYFLNKSEGRYSLDSFMPIYNTEKEFYDAPYINSIDTVLCFKPLFIELAIKSWRRDDVENVLFPILRNAHWQGDYGFGLQEDGKMTGEMSISPTAGVPVTQGHIDFMMTQLKAYQRKASKRPEFTPYVREIVREIEMMRRELDVQTGFTEAQIDTHYMAIALPEIDGKVSLEFDGDCFLKFWNFLNTCIKQLLPGSGRDSVISPVGFAYSSTMLLVDIVQANKEINPKHEEKARENVEKVKNTIKEIVGAAPILIGKGDPEKKLDTFFKKTKIDPVKAVPIIDKLAKVFPTPKARYESVKLVLPGEKQKVINLSKDRYLSFESLSAQLKEQTKIPPKTELCGFLGAVVVWDKERPKFTIKTEDKKRPTINYTHSDENDKKVRESIGKPVKIRVNIEGGRMYLADWL
jgi:hypothetical protein